MGFRFSTGVGPIRYSHRIGGSKKGGSGGGVGCLLVILAAGAMLLWDVSPLLIIVPGIIIAAFVVLWLISLFISDEKAAEMKAKREARKAARTDD